MNVAVAVSGGMDSLLSMALLKERGVEVRAVHGHFLPAMNERAVAALAEQCAALDVPFTAADLRPEFHRLVAEPFVQAYVTGRTPNPCALCNPAMKFGALFEVARELGATHLATGHYVRILEHPELGRVLVRGTDPAKDQSYFLCLLAADAVERAVFPLGDMLKRDVPAELKRRGLTPPISSESQEICFVPEDDYQRYLEQAGVELPGAGDIVLPDGTVVGRHQGLWRYTQGQRRGIGVSHPEPLYVLAKDMERNRLVVSTREGLRTEGCVGACANLLVDPARWPDTVLVQTRYRQRPVPARVRVEGEGGGARLVARFSEPGERPAPGQVLAVYAPAGAVLAGAVIESALDGEGR